jgi:hypothetical protein
MQMAIHALGFIPTSFQVLEIIRIPGVNGSILDAIQHIVLT